MARRTPYEVMRRDPELFDFASGKALGHIQTGREGTLGLFKDELLSCKNGVCTVQCITEYVGNEAKTYSLQKEVYRAGTMKRESETKCKGVPKHIVEKLHENVKRAALEQQKTEVDFRTIRLKGFVASHIFVKKVAMRGRNTKVHRLADGRCVPIGRYLSREG